MPHPNTNLLSNTFRQPNALRYACARDANALRYSYALRYANALRYSYSYSRAHSDALRYAYANNRDPNTLGYPNPNTVYLYPWPTRALLGTGGRLHLL